MLAFLLLLLNAWMHHGATWYGGRPQHRRLCVRWGPSILPKKGAERAPKFSAHVYCGQTAGWIKMALGMEVGFSPDDIVLDGDPASPPRRRGGSPSPLKEAQLASFQFMSIGWMKASFGTEVDLGPGQIVLDGVPALRPCSPQKRHSSPPLFSRCLLWPQSPV